MDPLFKLNPLPLPFHTSPQPPSLYPKDEIPNCKTPTRMTRQPLIKLSCQVPHLWQPSPWNKGKVMVFIMIPHVITKPIQRSVVRERFLRERDVNVLSVLRGCPLEGFGGGGGEDVVFCDEVACTRMQGSGEEGREDEVDEWFPAKRGDEEVVGSKLSEDIKVMQQRQPLSLHKHRPNRIKEDLKGAANQPPNRHNQKEKECKAGRAKCTRKTPSQERSAKTAPQTSSVNQYQPHQSPKTCDAPNDTAETPRSTATQSVNSQTPQNTDLPGDS
jgi:hypothetical protein